LVLEILNFKDRLIGSLKKTKRQSLSLTTYTKNVTLAFWNFFLSEMAVNIGIWVLFGLVLPALEISIGKLFPIEAKPIFKSYKLFNMQKFNKNSRYFLGWKFIRRNLILIQVYNNQSLRLFNKYFSCL